MVSLVTAVLSSLVEMAVKPGSSRDRSIILFLVTAVVVYLYSLAMLNVRPPVVSTLLAAAIIAAVDLVSRKRNVGRRGKGGSPQQPLGAGKEEN